MNESEIIARLILSTKRKKRDFSLIEIAEDISALKKIKGGLNEVSKVVGISTGMLNQFLSVFKLSTEIRNLVKERKIDSVAMVFLLTKFSEEDASTLAMKAADGTLTSQELKILLPYRRQHKKENILELLSKIEASKNIKVSVIKLPEDIVKKTPEQLYQIIKPIVNEHNILSVEKNAGFIEIKLQKEGEKMLRKIAKDKGMTLSELVITLIK